MDNEEQDLASALTDWTDISCTFCLQTTMVLVDGRKAGSGRWQKGLVSWVWNCGCRIDGDK